MKETFSSALRAEIEAVVARYEALCAAQREMFALAGSREADGLRAEIAAQRAQIAEQKAEIEALRARAEAGARAEAALEVARARIGALEADLRAGREVATALEEQFTAEKRFVEAALPLAGTMLAEALKGAVGRELEAGPATLAALKSKGLEAVLVQAFKDRGRSVGQAPLLERERGPLAPLAAAAGCELVAPEAGARFAPSAMEKAATVHDPAEEGNVVACLLPGLRRAGTEGLLAFPRVQVATG